QGSCPGRLEPGAPAASRAAVGARSELDRSRTALGSRWTLLLLAAAVGCAKPDAAEIVRPLETTLGAAVPAAYLAAVSMAALAGRASPCARVITPSGSG